MRVQPVVLKQTNSTRRIMPCKNVQIAQYKDSSIYPEILELRKKIYGERLKFECDTAPSTRFVLVRKKGTPIGFASAMHLHDAPDYRDEGLDALKHKKLGCAGLLKEMYFLEGAKRKGWGTKVLQAIETAYAQKGCTHMLTYPACGAETFFKKKGYTELKCNLMNRPFIKKIAALSGLGLAVFAYVGKCNANTTA